MKIEIIIATYCRHYELQLSLNYIEKSTRIPDRVIIVDATPEECFSYTGKLNIHYVHTDERGSTRQRNVGLEQLEPDTNIVTFLDDDMYIEKNYLENLIEAFEKDADLVGADGALRSDGGIQCKIPSENYKQVALYGCNMSFRKSAIEELRFDETLSEYAFMEDWDFSYSVAKNGGGYLLKLANCNGEHNRTPSGRVNDKKMGYMVIANHCYLHRKHGIFSSGDIMRYFSYILKKMLGFCKKGERERLKGACIAFWNVVILKKSLQLNKL